MKMKLSEIERVRAGSSAAGSNLVVNSTDPLQRERALLAKRAHDLLGYGTLEAHLEGRASISTAPGKLAEALNSNQIEVLDAGQVIQYQLEEVFDRAKRQIEEDLSNWATGWFRLPDWTRTPLTGYKQPIPEGVIAKAIKIKEVCPEVVFYVQHLENNPDPFLVAKCGSEVYYIDAWEEPRFEGRRV